jgi:hypothetical protein
MTTDQTVDGSNVDADHPVPRVREAHDAGHHKALQSDPSDEDAIADVASDESFPASDAPSHSAAGSSEPAPSSGYDEEAERELERRPGRSPMEDPGSPGGTAGTGGTSNEQDN